jgi:hypothetical protein
MDNVKLLKEEDVEDGFGRGVEDDAVEKRNIGQYWP